MLGKLLWIIALLTFASSLALTHGEHSEVVGQETDPEGFKVLKEKSLNLKTGLPRTLDPNLFKGKAQQAYRIAREIPEILAQIPCFCECETYGHENLLDCFIDRHGAG
jgi:hypothetical protein